MDFSAIQQIHQQQKEYFFSQATKTYEQRIKLLKDLKGQIEAYETRIVAAMQADMAKPTTEAVGGEIWYVLEEIEYTLRKLKHWMKPRRVRTPLLHFRASSSIYPEPYHGSLELSFPFAILPIGRCAGSRKHSHSETL